MLWPGAPEVLPTRAVGKELGHGHKPEATLLQSYNDLWQRLHRLRAVSATIMHEDHAAVSCIGKDSLNDKTASGQPPIVGIDVPHNGGQSEPCGYILHGRIDKSIGRAKQYRPHACSQLDCIRGPVQFPLHASDGEPRQIKVVPGVIGDYVSRSADLSYNARVGQYLPPNTEKCRFDSILLQNMQHLEGVDRMGTIIKG